MKKYGDDDDMKDRYIVVFKICQKPQKERTYHDKRKICSYLKDKVNFFKDLEKEKLEIIAPQIMTKEYETGDISKSLAFKHFDCSDLAR